MNLHEIPEFRSYLEGLESDYQLKPGLLSAVMRAESNGNPTAMSPAGARGAFQFMPATAKEYGIDPQDPIAAAEGAARYLHKSYRQFGDWDQAVGSYNAGPARIARTGLEGAPRETKTYVERVRDFLIPGAEAAEPPADDLAGLSIEELKAIAGPPGSDQPMKSMPYWNEEDRFKDEGIEPVSPESWAIGGLGAGRLALGAGKLAYTGGKAAIEGSKRFIRGASDEIKDMAKDLAVEEVVRYASGIPVVGGYVRPVYHLLRRGKDKPKPRSEAPSTPASKAEEVIRDVKPNSSRATVVDKGAATQEKIADILKTEKPRGAVEIEFVKKGTGERRTITGHLGIDKYAMSKGTPDPTGTLKIWEPARLTRDALKATPPRPASAALTAHRKKLSPAKEFPGDEGYRSIPIENILSIKPAGAKGKVEYRFSKADEVVAAVSKRKAKPPRVKFVKAPGAENDIAVRINTSTFDEGFKKDGGFYVGPKGVSESGVAGRYEGVERYLETGKPVEMARVHVDSEGRASFINGRHRYAVMRDRGIPMNVTMEPEAVANARRYGYLDKADEVVEAVAKRKRGRPAKPPVQVIGDTAIGGRQGGFIGAPTRHLPREEATATMTTLHQTATNRRLGDLRIGKSQRGALGGHKPLTKAQVLGNIDSMKSMLGKPEEFARMIVDLVDDMEPGSVGLRGLYATDKSTKLRQSRVWDDGNPTKETLGGTSAVLIAPDYAYNSMELLIRNIERHAKDVLSYGDTKSYALVVGSPARGGEDIGEIVMPDAKVIGVWRD